MKIAWRTSAALVLSLLAVLAGGGDARDVHASFTAASPVTLSSKATGAAADTTITTTIPGPDTNFSLIVWGTPSQATVAYGPGNPSFNSANHPALGDVVGTFTTTASHFGFSDTPCAANVTLSLTLLNATVDITDTIDPVPQASTNSGDGGTLANQWTDNGASPLADSPWSAASSGLTSTEQTNGLPAQVDDYPSHLKKLFTPDGGDPIQPYGGTPVQPRARYAAAAKVAGTVLTLNFVVFDSEALANAFAPPHPFDDLKGIGYTTIVILNDPTQPGSQVSVTDFCTPFTSTTTLYGQSKVNPCKVTPSSCPTPESINSPPPGILTGKIRYSNPGTGGTYLWTAIHQSLRDTDGDGKENQLDPCPATSDSLNPRLIGGDITNDSDLDAIPNVPSSCDSTTLNAGDHDQDDDGWSNALDNCPRAANPTQVESESSSTYATAGPRGGPKTDGIGDACDAAESACTDALDSDADGLVNDGCAAYLTNSEVGCLNNSDDDADGRVNDGCPSSQFVATGRFETTLTVTAQCIDAGPQVDGDGDGWCATTAEGSPPHPTGPGPASLNDPNDADSSRTPEDYDLFFPLAVAHSGSGATPPMRQPAQVCNDGIDNDGDTLIDILDSGAGNSTCRPKGLPTHPGYPTCPTNGCIGIDTDGDGFTDEVERHVGTDALGRCEVGASPARSTDWPSDFVSAGIPVSTDKVNVTDLTSFLAPTRRLDTSPGNANFNVRWDLVPGPGLFANWIVVNDLTSLIAGTSGFPPMPPFSGTKAFGVAACTAHPTYGD